MRPDERELDDEIRGHLALSVQERIEQGEDPEAARLAALREFGYLPAVRESMRRIWYSRWLDQIAGLAQDIRVGVRSLGRAKGLTAAAIVTLALGIGANAAIFSVVRDVLLRPLVNRGEDRLIYIRQSAPGLGADNLTFSVPEIRDLTSGASTVSAFADFSTVGFTMTGLGESRVVRAGVVGGPYFEVMGLRPVLGRLLDARDEGPDATGAVVLTHRFWTSSLGRNPSVIGMAIRLGQRSATVVGVLEPSVPYPADTEIIANVVTSPHHLGATMVTERTHRMTELFGRLAPGATIDQARAELTATHAAMVRAHPDAYPRRVDLQLTVTTLRDQIAAPARAVLLLLFAASALVFVIACSNVANLILSRSVRREGELALRAALGASRGALRRTLLAESLVLCGAGAMLGVMLAYPLVTVVARFAARFSVRAHDVTVDATLLWVGVGLALAAAVLLAYVPRLPSTETSIGSGTVSPGLRITPATTRRLRLFATAQIACSFVLLAGAGTLLAALVAVQSARPEFETRQVLVLDVPPGATGVGGDALVRLLRAATRRIEALPEVKGVAAGSFVPWRDTGSDWGPGFPIGVDGYTPEEGEEPPRGRPRIVAPGFFAVLGVPLVAGRDFTAGDRAGRDPVVIVSQSLAGRLFANGDALHRELWWTDPVLGPRLPRRIVGIVADVDDESIVPRPAMTVYHPMEQMGYASRLFVHTKGDPYAVVPAVTRIIRELSSDQAVERPATLEDVRAEVLAPDRLNAFVLSGFAAVALLIAVVGVAGVLAFGVSVRTREFGVRLAIGLAPWRLVAGVVAEGALIVGLGIVAGAAATNVFTGLAATRVEQLPMPSTVAWLGAGAVLAASGVLASLMPAVRAARTSPLRALHHH